MEKRLTQLISFVFHPVFAPLYGVFLIFQSNIYITYTLGFFAKAIIYGTLAVNCVLFPVLCIYFLYRKKFISDIYLSKQEERFFPLLFIASFYLFTYYLLFKIHVPAIISSFIFSGFVSSCLLILLNFKWKISMHTTASLSNIFKIYREFALHRMRTRVRKAKHEPAKDIDCIYPTGR
jgi:hypothetical protein